MFSAITAIIAGCARRGARNRTDAAVWSKPDMNTNEPRGSNPSAPTRDRDEPTHTSIGLWTNDIGDDNEGGLAATYAPGGGAMDGQIIYARPRDYVDLGGSR